jgi:7,8-dihydro-6-hydroxymethylpterin-pyrophosphokinase
VNVILILLIIIKKKNKKIINLPHPRMHKEILFLFPLFEIDKNWIHPISKHHIKNLYYHYQIETLDLLNKFNLVI